MKNSELVIDGQIFQTHALDRGMGRYSLYLIKSIAQNSSYGNIEIILNNKLKNHIKIKELLLKEIPGIIVSIIKLETADTCDIDRALAENTKVIEFFFTKKFSKDKKLQFLILSPFQEPLVPVFPKFIYVEKLLLFYDLIPFKFFNEYKNLMNYENYLRRFINIFEADKIFSISNSVKNDLGIFLGVPNSKVFNIDGAPIIRNEKSVKPKQIKKGIKFILMPTSDDKRKNNFKAVQGFKKFTTKNNHSDIFLIITSKINKKEQKKLSSACDKIIFSGNVPDSELNWLYKHCDSVLFAPIAEGLGLPILEAVKFRKKVICSSIDVFREISEDAFYYCNFNDVDSISEAIQLASEGYIKEKSYNKITVEYCWKNTAKKFVTASEFTAKKAIKKKDKIAIFAPNPSGLSAVGKVIAESHYFINSYFEADYFIESGLSDVSVRPNFLKYVAKCYPAEIFNINIYKQYDAIIYHIGNGDYHIESIKNALYLPGFIVLHDTNLKEAFRVMVELGMISAERAQIESLIEGRNGTIDSVSLVNSLVTNQIGVIAHSEFVVSAANYITGKQGYVLKTNLPTYVPFMSIPKVEKKITIGLAGIIANIKGIEIIENIAKDRRFMMHDIKIFGFNFTDQETISRLNTYPNITLMTNLSDFDFYSNMESLDIFVNYRINYNGETSLSTIEAMRQGSAVIVKDIGWYSEIPDEAVVKAGSAEEVLEKLEYLVINKKEVSRIGNIARDYIKDNFSYEAYAKQIANFIKNVNSNSKQNNISITIRNRKIKKVQDILSIYKEWKGL